MSLRNKHPETARNNRVKDSDILPIFDYKDAVTESQTFRLVGPALSYEDVWVDIVTQQGKTVPIPVRSIDLDPYTDVHTTDHCPVRKSGERVSRIYYINAIWREKQDAMPSRLPKPSAFESKRRTVMTTPDFPDGWKMYQMQSIESKTWTPFVVLRLTTSMVTELLEMSKENTRKVKLKTGKTVTRSADATDPRYGFDIKIKYFPKKSGEAKYKLVMGDVTPLTEEELNYPVWKIDIIKIPSLSETIANWKQIQDKMVDKNPAKSRKGEPLDDDDEDDGRNNKNRSTTGKRRDRDRDEDEDDDDRSTSKNKRSRSRLDDDDDVQDDDDAPF